MLFQIFIGLIVPAFAGDFNTLTASHADALRKTEQVVRSVGEAQLKLKLVLADCETDKITSQSKLLECAGKFYELHFQMQLNRAPLAETISSVESLAPEFQQSKDALRKVLQTCEDIVAVTSDTPKKLSEAFLNADSAYIQRQFTQASQSAFAKKRISLYCDGLQSDMDLLADETNFILNQRPSFALLYRQSVRVNSTLAMAKAVTKACHRNYILISLETAKKQLQPKLSVNAYASYKNEICSKGIAKFGLTATACRNLPLTSYAVHLLGQAGAMR